MSYLNKDRDLPHLHLMTVRALAVFLIAIGSIVRSSDSPTTASSTKSGNIVEIEVFGEAMCIHTTMFLRSQLIPAMKLFGSRLRIRYHPFGIRKYTKCTWNGANYECTCHHGQIECEKTALQACVIDILPRAEDYIDLVSCIQGKADYNTSIQGCIEDAPTSKQIDTGRLTRCARGDMGQDLIADHGTIQDRKAPGMSWVPWIMINGVRDQQSERHLQSQLCLEYLKPRPPECKMFGIEPTEEE